MKRKLLVTRTFERRTCWNVTSQRNWLLIAFKFSTFQIRFLKPNLPFHFIYEALPSLPSPKQSYFMRTRQTLDSKYVPLKKGPWTAVLRKLYLPAEVLFSSWNDFLLFHFVPHRVFLTYSALLIPKKHFIFSSSLGVSYLVRKKYHSHSCSLLLCEESSTVTALCQVVRSFRPLVKCCSRHFSQCHKTHSLQTLSSFVKLTLFLRCAFQNSSK